MKLKKAGITLLIFTTVLLMFLSSCKEVRWEVNEDGTVKPSLTFGSPFMVFSMASNSQGNIRSFALLEEPSSSKEDTSGLTSFYINSEWSALKKLLALLAPMASDIRCVSTSRQNKNDTLYTLYFEPFVLTSLEKYGFDITFNEDKFYMKIPPLPLEDVELNAEAFALIITFPYEVEMANSMGVDGKTVKWIITRGMLKNGVVLKAIFKR